MSSDLGDYANARVDRARLLCTEVTGSVQVGELDAVADGDVIACYDLTIPGRTNLKEAVTIANMLNTETVRLGEPVLLCILTLR